MTTPMSPIKLRLACGLAFAATTSVATAQTWNDEITADNPLHWFRMDETSGVIAKNYGSAAVDGEYYFDVTLGLQGPTGGAAGFDGVDDVLFLGEWELEQDWTAEFIFWCDTSGTHASQGLIGGWVTGLKADQYLQTKRFGFTEFGLADYTLAGDTPTTYAHAVFVRSATDIRLYINGVRRANTRTIIPLSLDVIGAGNWMGLTPTDPLWGEIDDVVIYDRALSEADVVRHFETLDLGGCYADCDTSTGAGVLDIFDFLCFQNSFVATEPYACDCDTSTGPLTCDVFDFLCFQNAFVAGCP